MMFPLTGVVISFDCKHGLVINAPFSPTPTEELHLMFVTVEETRNVISWYMPMPTVCYVFTPLQLTHFKRTPFQFLHLLKISRYYLKTRKGFRVKGQGGCPSWSPMQWQAVMGKGAIVHMLLYARAHLSAQGRECWNILSLHVEATPHHPPHQLI